MQIEKKTEYTLKLTQEEFVALYEYLGCTSQTARVSDLCEGNHENPVEKAKIVGQIWDAMYEAYE